MEERLVAVEHKTSQLEDVLQRFITHTNAALSELHREMLDFKKDTQAFKDEMRAFKDEMKAFKDEMLEFRRQSDRERKEMNKRWGELANKMGTIVEDIIFPAVRPVIKKYFECDPDFLGMRLQRKKGELREEFDVVATCGNSVILIEVKSTPRVQYISEFLKKVERFKELFTEYRSKKIIPIVASLNMDKAFVNALSKNGIYAMAYREWDYMDILNYDRVKKAGLS